jgi:hypothetical protein
MFGQALLTDSEAARNALEREVASSALAPRERLAVYRNNVLASLTEALRETFPVVCRLVGEPFFAFAAREFIAVHPPSCPELSAYGGAFPDFLAAFPPCRELVYLADTARLEWLMNVALYAGDVACVSASCLSGTAPEEAARLTFRFHPASGYLASAWPIDQIWLANQPEATDERVDLDAGGVRLEVSRSDHGVAFRTLEGAEFAFRKSLAGGAPLGIALEDVIASHSDFPVSQALAAVFEASLVVAVSLPPFIEEHAP